MTRNILALLALVGTAPFAWAQTGKPAAPPRKIDSLHELSGALEQLARRVNRAVVQISATGYSLGEDNDSTKASLLTQQRSTGSGVLLTPDGYIVTNSHVVQGARRLTVQLALSQREQMRGRPGRVLEGKIVGIDRDSDLAVVKVEGNNLPHLQLGDSNTLRQGQLVMAFGSPLGLENSVSMGIVAAGARQLKPDDAMVYIQTDASINPGNSGGPLVDADGQVMGLNTFILTQSGGSEGLGFAIPSNIVRSVYEQLRKSGHVHRGQIGIYAQSITPVLAAGLRLPQNWGVLAGDVTPGGPADEAGIQVGDVILSMDGRTMENARQLETRLFRHPVGGKVHLKVLRGSEELEFQVPVIEPEDDPMRFADLVDPDKNLIPQLGILGVEINVKTTELLGDSRKKYGVVVAARTASGPNADSGLEPGDIIYALNGTPTTTIDALRSAVKELKSGDAAVLQIERDGQLRFLAFEME
ncbi:MAG TPA: trypsin-like peptidase domain-containing protein [Bryobacteraceae bacterium]|nr:trypsin-like peptidase domain-containing protein [Bryobacteraceae bacterium]